MYKGAGRGMEERTGISQAMPEFHKPVDAVVMMLGTNDLKMDFGLCTEEIAAGAERLVQEIHDFAAEKQKFCPKIILMSPPEELGKISASWHSEIILMTAR